ncbi:MAG: hypothetical protein ABI637_00140 [Gemmatimonadota bacterium]
MRTILAGLLVLHAAPALAQGTSTLVVRRGGAEVGREQVAFQAQRRDGHSGSTLTISAKYPAANPTTEIGVRLERTPDNQLAVFQLDVERPDGPAHIFAAGAGARVILKTIAKGAEAGRELPGGPDVVLLDENVVGLYAAVADLATPAGARLSAIFPRSGRRASLVATRAGARIILSGEVTGTLGLDAGGRLVKVELPGQGIVATLAE